MFNRADTSSVVEQTVVIDTVHVVTNETVWYEPDSVGRQYPMKTIRRETGCGRVTMSESVYQARDTVIVSVDESRVSSNESQTRATDGKRWVPWMIVIGMVVVGVVIVVLRIVL